MRSVAPASLMGRLQRWHNRAARVLAAFVAGDFCNTLKIWHAIWRSLPLSDYEAWRRIPGHRIEPKPNGSYSFAVIVVGASKDDWHKNQAGDWAAGIGAAILFVQSFASKELKGALAKIRSDLVYVMAAGDRPTPDALLHLAALFSERSSLALAFSDHERRDGAGHLTPIFKPGWDPELQASGDYLGPGVMLRRGALPVDLADLNDLLLRWAPSLPLDAVWHLPLPLIESGGHWPSILEKRVAPRAPREPMAWPLVSLVIPTRDQKALLKVCLDGVLRQTDYPGIEVVLVDNASREKDTLAYLEEIQAQARVRVLRDPGAFNFSRLNNRAVEIAKGEVLVLLNNDTQVIEPQWLKALVAQVLRPEVGVVGAQLLYADGSLQHAGISLGIGGNAWHFLAHEPPESHALACYPRQVAAVTGACMAIRRQVYRDLGGLDENFPVTFNDVDLCLKARQMGLRVLLTPGARLYHHESKSRGVEFGRSHHLAVARARRHLARLHGKAGQSDPFFNPNLTPGLSEPRLVRRRP